MSLSRPNRRKILGLVAVVGLLSVGAATSHAQITAATQRVRIPSSGLTNTAAWLEFNNCTGVWDNVTRTMKIYPLGTGGGGSTNNFYASGPGLSVSNAGNSVYYILSTNNWNLGTTYTGSNGVSVAGTVIYVASGTFAPYSVTNYYDGWIVPAMDARLANSNNWNQAAAHTNRTDNPHAVTALQVGALPAGGTNGLVASITGGGTWSLSNGAYTFTPTGITAAAQSALDGKLPTNTTVSCAGGGRNTFFYEPLIVDLPRLIPASGTNTLTVTDAIKTVYTTGSTQKHDKFVSSTITRLTSNESISIAWTLPGSTTFDGTNTITHVTDGAATGTWSSASWSWTTNIVFTTGAASAYTNWTGGVSGSARSNAVAMVDPLLSGKQVAVYSTLNHSSTNYVRNTNCWAYTHDLSCVPVWNSSMGDSRKAGTLISPRHILFANHYTIADGTSLRFVTTNNVIVTRTMTTSTQVNGSDLRVGLLDSAVTNCSFATVLPASYTNQFPNDLQRVPLIGFDQEQHATILDGYNGSSSLVPEIAARLAFYEDKIPGDSGQPCLMILNNQPVLLTVWSSGGSGSGYFVTSYIADINGVMTSLGGGYTLTTNNLSGFNSYP